MSRWHSLGKPKLKYDFDEEKRVVEALKETQRRNEEWKALEVQKKNLKDAIKKKQNERALNILHGIEKRSKSLEHFTAKELKAGVRFTRPYLHRYLKKRKARLARYI